MRIVMNNDAGDGIRVIETLIESRAAFERFVEGLFLAAEAIWPMPDESGPEIETLPALPLRCSPDPAPPAGRRKNEGIAARNARIIHMCRVEKRPRKDVAAAFGVSEKVIDNVLYRAVRA